MEKRGNQRGDPEAGPEAGEGLLYRNRKYVELEMGSCSERQTG